MRARGEPFSGEVQTVLVVDVAGVGAVVRARDAGEQAEIKAALPDLSVTDVSDRTLSGLGVTERDLHAMMHDTGARRLVGPR
jgi:hypothetical protein